MTKQDVQLLCEDDPQLQWWAMILFAEISEIVNSNQPMDAAVLSVIKTKVKEFPNLVVSEQLKKAKEKAKESQNAQT